MVFIIGSVNSMVNTEINMNLKTFLKKEKNQNQIHKSKDINNAENFCLQSIIFNPQNNV